MLVALSASANSAAASRSPRRCAEAARPAAFSGNYDRDAAVKIRAAGFEQGSPAKSSYLIVDSYEIDSGDLSVLRNAGYPLVLFDDVCTLEVYPADVILSDTVVGLGYDVPEGPALVRSAIHVRRPRSRERVGGKRHA